MDKKDKLELSESDISAKFITPAVALSTWPKNCVLQWVLREHMTNLTLRERFGVSESSTNTISQIISATIEQGLIKLDSNAPSSSLGLVLSCRKPHFELINRLNLYFSMTSYFIAIRSYDRAADWHAGRTSAPSTQSGPFTFTSRSNAIKKIDWVSGRS